jgi:hypothetical protein
MNKRLPYQEGTWFALPFAKGGYGVGCVARHSPKGRIVLAYFFGPRRQVIPDLADLDMLDPDDAIAIMRIGDLGLIDGTWRIIGELACWDRGRWPVPTFTRTDTVLKPVAWRVRYSDDDPGVLVSEERIPFEAGIPSSSGLFGAEAAVIALSRILEG